MLVRELRELIVASIHQNKVATLSQRSYLAYIEKLIDKFFQQYHALK